MDQSVWDRFTLPMKGAFYEIDSRVGRIVKDDSLDDDEKKLEGWRAVANTAEPLSREELVDLVYGFAYRYAKCRADSRRRRR